MSSTSSMSSMNDPSNTSSTTSVSDAPNTPDVPDVPAMPDMIKIQWSKWTDLHLGDSIVLDGDFITKKDCASTVHFLRNGSCLTTPTPMFIYMGCLSHYIDDVLHMYDLRGQPTDGFPTEVIPLETNYIGRKVAFGTVPIPPAERIAYSL